MVPVMVLTNAERQAAFRARLKTRASSGVTASDVLRAVRLSYDACMVDCGETPDFDAWLAKAKKDKTGKLWRQMVPTSANPDDYPDDMPASDREFLAKVGSVGGVVLSPI